MNILFLTQVLPYPLDAGPKVRAYYMLRHLAGRHRVTLVSFVRPDDRPEYVAHLQGIAHAVHTVPIRRSAWRNIRAGVKGLLTGLPMVIARDEIPEMAALLRRLVAETRFDVIHADQLSMAGWGLLAARGAGETQPAAASMATDVALDAGARPGPQQATASAGALDAGACHGTQRIPQQAAASAGALDAGACHGTQQAATSARPRTLLDEHNAIYHLAERMAAEATGLRRLLMRREAAAFRRYEAAILHAYDAVLAVTEEDRALLLELLSGFQPPMSNLRLPDDKITVIPICVAPEAVQPVSRAIQTPSPQSAIGNPPTILHLGTMFWPPNVTGVLWFARQVLPLIWQQAPEARFIVVGKNPPAEVQALAADPRIEVTGYVADPWPYLEAADVFVVPLFSGGGMRVKIVDAWLWGLPVVSTPIGAEGIAVRDGENILLAADAAGFAAATLRLLADPDLNTRLRVAGRRWVEEHYAWQVVYRRVDAVYEQLSE